MKLVNACLCIYFLLKPYYLSKSGTIQIADFFMVFAFILLMSIKSKQNVISNNISKIKPLMIFVCFVLIINSIYFLIYGTNDFLLSSLQYVFILMGVYVFYSILGNEKLILNINKILKINIIIQVIIFLLDLGRDYNGTRYMGTFNDPNQFGFYILLSFLIIRVIDKNRGDKFFWFYFIISTFLIIKSASTGMILGLGVYVILCVFGNCKKITKYMNMHTNKIFIICCILFLVISFLLCLYCVDENFKIKVNTVKNISNLSVIERIKEKIEKIDNNSSTIFEERGLDKILYYPEYCLYGAGQGNYFRFEDTKYSRIEIHSTLPGILFYYGVIPFGVLIYWIYTNLRNLKFSEYIPYIAIFIESFTLANQRQLLLWFMIILANKYVKKSRGDFDET